VPKKRNVGQGRNLKRAGLTSGEGGRGRSDVRRGRGRWDGLSRGKRKKRFSVGGKKAPATLGKGHSQRGDPSTFNEKKRDLIGKNYEVGGGLGGSEHEGKRLLSGGGREKRPVPRKGGGSVRED